MTPRGYRATHGAALAAENPGSKDFAHDNTAGAAMARGSARRRAIARCTDRRARGPRNSRRPRLGAKVCPAESRRCWDGAADCGAVLGWIGGLVVDLGRSEYVAKRYVGRMPARRDSDARAWRFTGVAGTRQADIERDWWAKISRGPSKGRPTMQRLSDRARDCNRRLSRSASRRSRPPIFRRPSASW